METASRYRLFDLFIEALHIEWRIVQMLGQAIARAAVLVFVQLMDVIRYPAALVVDLLGLFLGVEIRTVVGVPAADDTA